MLGDSTMTSLWDTVTLLGTSWVRPRSAVGAVGRGTDGLTVTHARTRHPEPVPETEGRVAADPGHGRRGDGA